MSIFEILYDLSIKLLMAQRDSELGRLTQHHYTDQAEAERIVKKAVLDRGMPGEHVKNRWEILRVFMCNLVNRAQAPIPLEKMRECLNNIELLAGDESKRIDALVNAVSGNPRLMASLQAILDSERAPDECGDYLHWLGERINEYSGMTVTDIDADHLLSQLSSMAVNHETKIPNMGIPLAANLFADLGIRAAAKPDLHVRPTVRGLLRVDKLSEKNCIRNIIKFAKVEAQGVNKTKRFDWLTGGLYPRDIDRMIYLIGSDNFLLDGQRLRQRAPQRRELMLKVLLGETVEQAIASTAPCAAPQVVGRRQRRGSQARNVNPSAGEGPSPSASEKFSGSIKGDKAACELVRNVEKLCGELQATVHHTSTYGGDLRVRASREGAGRKNQNVITMRWTPNSKRFSCNAILSYEKCIKKGFAPDRAAHINGPGPLPTQLKVIPGTDDIVFLSIVSASVQAFRDG